MNQCKQPVELANTAAAAVRTSSLFMNRTSSKDCISRRGGGSNNSTPLCVMCKRNVMFFCAINVADSAHDCRKHERPYEKYVAVRGIGKADELSARTPSSPQALAAMRFVLDFPTTFIEKVRAPVSCLMHHSARSCARVGLLAGLVVGADLQAWPAPRMRRRRLAKPLLQVPTKSCCWPRPDYRAATRCASSD